MMLEQTSGLQKSLEAKSKHKNNPGESCYNLYLRQRENLLSICKEFPQNIRKKEQEQKFNEINNNK